MVEIKNSIAMNPGSASRQPPQMEPHVIPDVTEVMTPDMKPYYGRTIKVPLMHRYNTRSIILKVHNIMSDHVTTIVTPRKMPPPTTTIMAVHHTGEEWVIKNIATGEVAINPRIMNSLICPDTGKFQ